MLHPLSLKKKVLGVNLDWLFYFYRKYSLVGSMYLRHKPVATLNLFGPNTAIKEIMTPVLQATGAAQWSTRLDMKGMNVCNREANMLIKALLP